MAPMREKLPTIKKSQSDSFESKTNRFSFRWFLKRSKSSKSSKEMAATEKPAIPTIVISKSYPAVVVSKSCDADMSNFVKLDKCSTSLLRKLLPNHGKITSETDKSKKFGKDKNFKISYSCDDVHTICPVSKTPGIRPARSSYNIGDNLDVLCHQDKNLNSSHSLLNKCKRNSSFDYLKLLLRSDRQDICNYCTTGEQFVLCKLCLTMVPQKAMFVLEDCSCSFCLSCMQQYLLVNVKEGNTSIMCPDADCVAKGKVFVNEIQDLVSDEVFYRYEKYKLDRDVELDPFRTWCPTPGCETICRFYPSTNPDTGVSVFCLNCKFTFCSSCKLRWHSNKTCEEIRSILQDEEDFSFNSDDEDAIIKRCPNCRIPIERDEGCAQMMCKKCKHVFCWHCLSSLDDDFLLRHYDKGPCRNKLGHSRASMVWHRTQVVGIFAGFSFLLLVASPILLLAAPCLLCCRCKNCKFFYEETTPL